MLVNGPEDSDRVIVDIVHDVGGRLAYEAEWVVQVCFIDEVVLVR